MEETTFAYREAKLTVDVNKKLDPAWAGNGSKNILQAGWSALTTSTRLQRVGLENLRKLALSFHETAHPVMN